MKSTMEFKGSQVYKDILKELYFTNSEHSIDTFECYVDEAATYELKIDNTRNISLTFIGANFLLKEMSCYDILDLKGITYFYHCIYENERRVASRTFKK